jgi:molecular chaperone HtpG
MADAHPKDAQSFGFQAEVAKLLHMMVHAVYSEREVFLRELISNAADACDRRRYEALTDAALLGETALEVVISVDPQARTLTLADSGIGMSRDELIDNLGTIARSGTARFAELAKAGQAGAPELIGQFGVGFYSAFMVADKVSVTSRKAGSEEAWTWTSDGLGQFEVAPSSRAEVGTTIVLHMKEDAGDFLEKPRLSHIIRTYSDHIAIPVKLGINAEVPEAMNSAQALWTRPKSDISEDDHKGFYRHLGGLWDEPLHTLHFKAEGRLDYTCLLYTPSQAPQDLFDPARQSKVKLYVKRVFITDDCSTLLPPYLRFLKGVVDAQDLSLNISREMLQNNPVLGAMKSAITGKVLSDYAKLADKQPETWTKLWEQFGRVLKEGLYEDFERRDELLKLARFRSTRGDGWVSLDDYKAAMKDGQNAIYVLAAEDRAALSSPQIEGFKARGVEVLLLSDPIDDFWLGMIPAYADVPFKSITKSGTDLKDLGDVPEQQATDSADIDRLIGALKAVLGEQVKDIQSSDRLTESPVCLVAEDHDLDLRLQRMLKLHDKLKELSPRILEINPRHELVKTLAAKVGQDGAAALFELAAPLLLDQARLLEGETLPDPAGFARRMSEVLLKLAA